MAQASLSNQADISKAVKTQPHKETGLKKASERDIENIEKNYWKAKGHEMLKDWRLYAMLVPMFFFLICWKYLPIASIVMSFKNYTGTSSIYSSTNVGLLWFQQLLFGKDATDFWKAFRNTFVLSFYGLFFGFPVPIILALLFSEIKAVWYRAILQVLSYLPHFVSVVVVTSIVTMLLRKSVQDNMGNTILGAGPLAYLFEACGVKTDIVHDPACFRSLYIISGIWSDAGYGSIVYFAAVLGVSPTNYEAARIDGASKMQQVKYVTIPGMLSTLVIMLILRIGSLFSIGYEKVILLNPEGKNSALDLYETAQIISTYVYYNALGTSPTLTKSAAAAADFFNSLLAMLLVIGSNRIAKKVSKTSLY
jgi:putative aldouronate transport system permease protein